MLRGCLEMYKMMFINDFDGMKAIPEHFNISRLLQFFRIMSICTGTPPERFTWEYKDRDGKLNTIGPITPRDFFETHVRPVFDPADKVWSNTGKRFVNNATITLVKPESWHYTPLNLLGPV